MKKFRKSTIAGYPFYRKNIFNRFHFSLFVFVVILVWCIRVRPPFAFHKITNEELSSRLVFWSTSLHDGCRIDSATLLQGLNQTVILADHKVRSNPYADAFKRPNILFLSENHSKATFIDSFRSHNTPITENEARQFFLTFYKDPMMLSVNAFYCSFPMSFCEIYMPFNRTIIWLPAHRFTLGRCSRPEIDRLIQHLQQSAQVNHEPRSFVAAGGRFDQEYIKYYTGLDAILLPTNSFWYAFNVTQFTQRRPEVLVGPLQIRSHPLINNMTQAAVSLNSTLKFCTIKQLYGHFQLQQVADHRAIVLLPYAVLSYGITELYTLGIPIFIPSIDFIVQLNLVNDRTLIDHHNCGHRLKFSDLPKQHHDSKHPYSPDDIDSFAATRYWLQFADYYQLPHIQTFSSWENLIEKLSTADFKKINNQIYEENLTRKAKLVKDWQSIFAKIDPHPRIIPNNYETALHKLWNTSRLQAI